MPFGIGSMIPPAGKVFGAIEADGGTVAYRVGTGIDIIIFVRAVIIGTITAPGIGEGIASPVHVRTVNGDQVGRLAVPLYLGIQDNLVGTGLAGKRCGTGTVAGKSIKSHGAVAGRPVAGAGKI